MKLLVNKNTMLKLHKLSKEYNNEIILDENSALGQYFKNNYKIEVVLDKTKMNNEIEIIEDRNRKSLFTNYEIFINSLKDKEINNNEN